MNENDRSTADRDIKLIDGESNREIYIYGSRRSAWSIIGTGTSPQPAVQLQASAEVLPPLLAASLALWSPLVVGAERAVSRSSGRLVDLDGGLRLQRVGVTARTTHTQRD